MEQLLLDREIWPAIKKYSKKAHRIWAAIAYVSNHKHLCMKKGDKLVVNASDEAIRSGSTSAKVLWKFHRKNVILYNAPYVHAKLVILGSHAVIGSANLSGQSATHLWEAAVLTDNLELISRAQSGIHLLTKQAALLSEKDLVRLKSIKVRRLKGLRGRPRRREPSNGKYRCWFVNTADDDKEHPDEQKAVDRAKRALKVSHPQADPIRLRFIGRSNFRKYAKREDTIIDCYRSGSTVIVRPPAAILERVDHPNATSFLYDWDLLGRKSLKWKTFMKLKAKLKVQRKLTPNHVCSLKSLDWKAFMEGWPKRGGP